MLKLEGRIAGPQHAPLCGVRSCHQFRPVRARSAPSLPQAGRLAHPGCSQARLCRAARTCGRCRPAPRRQGADARPLTTPAPGASPPGPQSRLRSQARTAGGACPSAPRAGAALPARRHLPHSFAAQGGRGGSEAARQLAGARRALSALGAEGHVAMVCGLRRPSASGVPRGQPPPWRGARGSEPARNFTHRAGALLWGAPSDGERGTRPSPWRGARGAEPARNFTHRAGALLWGAPSGGERGGSARIPRPGEGRRRPHTGYASTRPSPSRLVILRSSRCSRKARAYLRLLPKRSRSCPTLTLPVSAIVCRTQATSSS